MNIKILAVFFCSGLGVLLNENTLSAGPDLKGSWKGSLGSIELIFHLEEKTDSGWSGSVDSPQQNSYGLAATVTVKPEGGITISVPSTAATCEARLDSETGKIRGTWNQRGSSIPLELSRTDPRTPLSADLAAKAAGLYEGKAVIQLISLRMVLNLEVTEGSQVRGYLISSDQSPDEIQFERFDQIDDRRLRLCAPSIFLTLDLILSEDGNELAGLMLQGAGKFPFKLERRQEISKPQRPQTPQPPFPYREFHWSGDAESWCPIGATLTVPEGNGPFPVAIMISGSGTQDRDSAIFGHQPFRVIADHLARKGIATIRYDDPGIGETPILKNQDVATTYDYMKLAQKVFKLASEAEEHFQIKTEKGEIAQDLIGNRIGYIGHSEGAIIAQLLAANSDPKDARSMSFAISLAGPGVRGDQLLLEQNRALSIAEGIDQATYEAGLKLNRKLFTAVLNAPDKEAEGAAEDAVNCRVESFTDEKINELLASEDELTDEDRAQFTTQMSIPWIRWFIRYDPEWALKKIRIPHLLVFGKKDLQVPWESNVKRVRQILDEPSLKKFDQEILIFDDLNHLFQKCQRGTVSEYGEIEETFSPLVLDAICNWILQRFRETD